MRKYKILTIIVLASLLGGCKHKTQESSEPTSTVEPTQIKADSVNVLIDVDAAKNMSNALKKIASIKFDEDAENFIGIPQNLVVRGDTLFAIDSYKAPGFYAYDRNGNQLFSYCAIGDGPEEFYDLSDLIVGDTTISAFDRSNGQIIVIDKKGKFNNKYEIPSNVYGAIIDSAGDYWIDFSNNNTDDAKLAWRPDTAINYKSVLPVPEVLKGMTNIPLQQFYRLTDGETIYLPSFENKIYRLKSGKALLKYNLDFNGLWPTDEEMHKWQGNDWALKMRDFPIEGLICQENERWLVVGFNHDGKLYIHTYNKESKKGKTYVNTDKSYYIPMDVYGDELFMLRSDGYLDVLNIE